MCRQELRLPHQFLLLRVVRLHEWHLQEHCQQQGHLLSSLRQRHQQHHRRIQYHDLTSCPRLLGCLLNLLRVAEERNSDVRLCRRLIENDTDIQAIFAAPEACAPKLSELTEQHWVGCPFQLHRP